MNTAEISTTFRDIYIGLPDGEQEAKNEMFEQLFCNVNNKYEELVTSPEKFLVIGSKGSGKTYLANYICKKEKHRKCKIVNASDLLTLKIESIEYNETEEIDVYSLCMCYVYKKLVDYVLEIHAKKAKYNCFSGIYKLRKLKELYDDEGCIYKTNKKSIVTNKTLELNSNRIASEKKQEITIQGSSGRKRITGNTITTDYEKKNYIEICREYKRILFNVLKRKDKVFLIFDDLDELDIKIILLVRSDILDKLQFCDMNLGKIKTSCGIDLYWLSNTESSPEKHPLMHMIIHKLKASSDEFSQFTDVELYKFLFPNPIDKKSPLNYLLDYSFGRPRDIIMHLNHVINEYPDNKQFTSKSLKSVKKLYSVDFYNEMVNQAYFHKPVEYTKACLNLISSVEGVTFSYEQIKQHYESNIDMYEEIDCIEEAISFLYKLGVIGNTWDGGKKSSWYYKKDAMDDVDKTKLFTIHYALRKKFSKG